MAERSRHADERPVDFDECERVIGYAFRDRALLESALTHASGADHRLESNERMEFLGDAILGAVVCERLYRRFPEYLEGDLTKLKSVIVSRQTCAKLSQSLGLDQFMILGKGMTSTPGVPTSVFSDVFEALVAAIYLDGGIEQVDRFIDRTVDEEIELAASGSVGDNYKSQLQQVAQRDTGATPNYVLLDEQGPDHSKCFLVAAQFGGKTYAAAWGRSKKDSEQRAAQNALCELRDEPPPHADAGPP